MVSSGKGVYNNCSAIIRPQNCILVNAFDCLFQLLIADVFTRYTVQATIACVHGGITKISTAKGILYLLGKTCLCGEIKFKAATGVP